MAEAAPSNGDRSGSTVSRPVPGVEVETHVQIERARQAQAGWEETSLSVRLALVRRLRRLIARHGRSLAASALRDHGQLLAEKLVSEVIPLADACRFLEKEARGILLPRRIGRRGRPAWLAGVSAEVHREPYGTVLVIAPANYPLLLPGVQAIQAIVAGNAVAWKPGARGGAAARLLVKLLGEAGLPPDLVATLSEEPAAARDAIVSGVDKVVLTGSAETGRAVLADLAPRLIPAALELSGCDAVFVLEDADLDLVCRALAFGLRLNRGETCLAPRRVFVAKSVAADLERRLVEHCGRMAPIAIAPGRGNEVGRIIDEALEHGARRIVGPTMTRTDGSLGGPQVVADARPAMRIMREESFAPLLALMSVDDDDDEALRVANECPYALGAAIFGGPGRAESLARRVRAGMVVVNDLIVPTADPRLPFGGRGRSGYGVTRGAEGLLELTRVKVVARRRGRFHPHFEPLDESDVELADAYLAAAHGSSWGGRLVSAVKLVRIMVRKARNGSGSTQ